LNEDKSLLLLSDSSSIFNINLLSIKTDVEIENSLILIAKIIAKSFTPDFSLVLIALLYSLKKVIFGHRDRSIVDGIVYPLNLNLYKGFFFDLSSLTNNFS
jgi:hypothetical protein